MFTAEEKKVVRKARQLITNRANWCKGEFAKAHNGHAVEVASQKACKFCAIGALCHAALDLGYDLQCREPSEDTPIDRLAAKVSPPELRLVDINDSRGGHRKVLALPYRIGSTILPRTPDGVSSAPLLFLYSQPLEISPQEPSNIFKTCQSDYQPGNAKSTSLFATTATCRNLPQPRTNATSTPPTSWSNSKQHALASVTPPFRILCILSGRQRRDS